MDTLTTSPRGAWPTGTCLTRLALVWCQRFCFYFRLPGLPMNGAGFCGRAFCRAFWQLGPMLAGPLSGGRRSAAGACGISREGNRVHQAERGDEGSLFLTISSIMSGAMREAVEWSPPSPVRTCLSYTVSITSSASTQCLRHIHGLQRQ